VKNGDLGWSGTTFGWGEFGGWFWFEHDHKPLLGRDLGRKGSSSFS